MKSKINQKIFSRTGPGFLCLIVSQSRRLSLCDAVVAQSANQRHTAPQAAGFITNILDEREKNKPEVATDAL